MKILKYDNDTRFRNDLSFHHILPLRTYDNIHVIHRIFSAWLSISFDLQITQHGEETFAHTFIIFMSIAALHCCCTHVRGVYKSPTVLSLSYAQQLSHRMPYGFRTDICLIILKTHKPSISKVIFYKHLYNGWPCIFGGLGRFYHGKR